MADFLSNEWIDELAAKLGANSEGSSPAPLTVQYVVATDDGEVAYHLVLGPEGDTAASGVAEAPDVTFRLDEATAREISSGALSSQEAFIAGRLDIEGDTGALIEAHRASGDA